MFIELGFFVFLFSLLAYIRAYSAKFFLFAGLLAVNVSFDFLVYKVESLCFILIKPSFRASL